MIFILNIVLSLTLGLYASHLFFNKSKTMDLRFLVNLSMPLGIGISTFIFIVLNILGFPTFLTFCLEIIAIGYILFKHYKKQQVQTTSINYLIEKFNLNQSVIQPILLLTVILYLYSWAMNAGIFYFESVQNPHGLWDAWSCWNLISKFISRAPDIWPQLLHQMNAIDFHPDYPLLQRGFIAKCWLLLGNESVWVPIFSAFVFTFCTIGLLASAVGIFNSKTDGLIAGLIMLCTPFFMVMGYSQYADNTVGYFYLATIILLTFARKGRTTNTRLLIAAGITAGMAAWSKNEGLLFIVCLFTSQLVHVFFKDHRIVLNELKYLLLGILPFLVIIAYQKFIIAPPNQIISAQGEATFDKLADVSRYKIVFAYFVEQFSTFGKWAINPWWFILAGVLLRGGINVKENNYSFLSNIILVSMMVIGFFFVEIITPHGLSYYLSTSVHRLFFQLFPTFLFIYFVAINGKQAKFRFPFISQTKSANT
jgi:hypothetical protein